MLLPWFNAISSCLDSKWVQRKWIRFWSSLHFHIAYAKSSGISSMWADWDPSDRYIALLWLHFHDPVINYLVLGKEEHPSSRTDFKAVNENQNSPDLSTAISGSKLSPCLHLVWRLMSRIWQKMQESWFESYASCKVCSMRHGACNDRFETPLKWELALPPTQLRWPGRQDIKLLKKDFSTDRSNVFGVDAFNIVIATEDWVEDCTFIHPIHCY